MHTLVLLRHGQSQWNYENRFTGWVDSPLTERGVKEARDAGLLLKEKNYPFDVVFTSVQKRATETTRECLATFGAPALPVVYAWELCERHYGGLQGLNKAETAAKFGEAQVKIWRRSYDQRPPPLDDARFAEQLADPTYASVPKDKQPRAECLADVVARVLPYWTAHIAPEIRAGKRVLISSHGNSLRALVQFLDQIPKDQITEFNIPTGIPLVYELDDNLKPVRHYFLADPATLQKALDEVQKQGKAAK